MQPKDFASEKDDFVQIVEYVRYTRCVPRKIYEITNALNKMSAAEQTMVMEYIARINNRQSEQKN